MSTRLDRGFIRDDAGRLAVRGLVWQPRRPPKVIDDDMLTFALSLRAKGVAVPKIAARPTITSGKNAGKRPSVASLYRALADVDSDADQHAGREVDTHGWQNPGPTDDRAEDEARFAVSRPMYACDSGTIVRAGMPASTSVPVPSLIGCRSAACCLCAADLCQRAIDAFLDGGAATTTRLSGARRFWSLPVLIDDHQGGVGEVVWRDADP